jgi:DNA-binding response OmpR family regulator
MTMSANLLDDPMIPFSKCDDGVAAIEKAKECSPDLVVVDLNLPRLNG